MRSPNPHNTLNTSHMTYAKKTDQIWVEICANPLNGRKNLIKSAQFAREAHFAYGLDSSRRPHHLIMSSYHNSITAS